MCIFCKIVKNKEIRFTVDENEHFVAFLDINPIGEGHTLIIPKKHYSLIWDMPANEYTAIFEYAKSIAKKLQKVFQPKTVGLAIEGLSVPHTHIHLVPINSINGLDPNIATPKKKEELAETHRKITGSE